MILLGLRILHLNTDDTHGIKKADFNGYIVRLAWSQAV